MDISTVNYVSVFRMRLSNIVVFIRLRLHFKKEITVPVSRFAQVSVDIQVFCGTLIVVAATVLLVALAIYIISLMIKELS